MRTHADRGKRDGFTFMEIMMSVLILSILAGLVIPAAYNFIRSPLNLAANQFVSIFQDLKFNSIISNRYLALTLDPEKNVYLILSQNPDSGDWEPDAKFKEPIPISSEVKIKSMLKGIKSITKEKVRLIFGPSGLVELFEITFFFDDEEITVEIKDVFGKIETGEIELLQGFVL